jgi:hypothetical protein
MRLYLASVDTGLHKMAAFFIIVGYGQESYPGCLISSTSSCLDSAIYHGYSPFSPKLTLSALEQREAELCDPEGPDKVDVDLPLDVTPRLPVKLSADAHAGVVDESVQA